MSVASGCPQCPPPTPRHPFLDGLRGLAALYVVLHHAALMVPPAGLSGASITARFLLRHGHYAVALFIVLSGYCLMLPAALDPRGRLPGGLVAYLVRRARRILPPYYAALGLCGLLIALVPPLGQQTHSRWDRALPATGPGVVVSHLLLVHTLSERWLFKIDPPMWSVAAEWQIYLLFPALLALWRRRGIVATVAAGFALGYAAAVLSTTLGNPALRESCPWYAGLFTLGMAAAVASSTPRPFVAVWRVPDGWMTAGLGLLALVTAGLALSGGDDQDILVGDLLVGVATALLLVRWTRRATAWAELPRPPLLRLLESRWAVGLGAFSYSLYLVHYPLLALADARLRARAWAPQDRLAALTLVASPLCLLAAWLFHLAFERPTLPHRHPRARASGTRIDAALRGVPAPAKFRPARSPRPRAT